MEHRKNRPYPTAHQKARLISLVKKDPELMRGKITNTFTKQDSNSRWNAVSIELNSLPGAKKTTAEWRKTWQDMKSNFKKKQALRRAAPLTDEEPAPEVADSDILYTLKESVLADLDCGESVYVHDNPSTSSETASVNITLMPEDSLVGASNSVDIDHDVNVKKTAPSVLKSHQLRTRSISNGKKRILMPQKKTSRSAEMMTLLERLLREKNELKRQFYKDFLKEMRRQTDAFLGIASACSLLASNCVSMTNNECPSD